MGKRRDKIWLVDGVWGSMLGQGRPTCRKFNDDRRVVNGVLVHEKI